MTESLTHSHLLNCSPSLPNPTHIHRWTILKGDQVEVINGPEKGKQGTVLKVLRAANRLIIEGVNVRRRTQKPTPNGQAGKIITYPAALNVSNVSLLDPESKQPTKVSRRFLEDGTRVRVGRRSGVVLPKPEWKRENIRRAAVGGKDTLPADVYEVTWEDYVAPERKEKKKEGPTFAAAAAAKE